MKQRLGHSHSLFFKRLHTHTHKTPSTSIRRLHFIVRKCQLLLIGCAFATMCGCGWHTHTIHTIIYVLTVLRANFVDAVNFEESVAAALSRICGGRRKNFSIDIFFVCCPLLDLQFNSGLWHWQ